MSFLPDEEESFGLELTSLIDVVFLLLVFFMVTTTFVDFSRRLEIELPSTYSGLTLPQMRRIVVDATRTGKLYLNGDLIEAEDLPQALRRMQAANPGPVTAIVRADRRLAYGSVIKIIDACKRAGIKRVAVAVE